MDVCAGCHRDADHIVEERPEEVLVDVLKSLAAEPDCLDCIFESAVDQDDIGCIKSDICTCSDSYTYIGSCQGRGIVDAVADHCGAALLHELTDDFFLAVRQDFGDDLVYSDLSSDSFSCFLPVTCEHYSPDAHLPEFLNCLNAVISYRICKSDETEEPAAFLEENWGLACVGEFSSFLHEPCDISLSYIVHYHEVSIAACDTDSLGAIPCVCSYSAAGDLLVIADPECRAAYVSADGFGERVLGSGFDSGCDLQEFILRNALAGENICDFRVAACDSAGLVEGDYLNTACLLKCCSGFEQDAVPRSDSAADHDGNRGGKSEGARTADDKYRDCTCECKTGIFTNREPYDECDQSDAYYDRHENA